MRTEILAYFIARGFIKTISTLGVATCSGCKALGRGGTAGLGAATCSGCSALGGGGEVGLGVATCSGCKALGGGGKVGLGVATCSRGKAGCTESKTCCKFWGRGGRAGIAAGCGFKVGAAGGSGLLVHTLLGVGVFTQLLIPSRFNWAFRAHLFIASSVQCPPKTLLRQKLLALRSLII